MKKRPVIFIAAFSAIVAAAWAMSARPPGIADQPPAAISIFLTGNEFGEMKPCGCASGQLGGLDRRAALLSGSETSRKLIVDTGNFVDTEAPQDLIKFNIIGQSLGLLDYDLVVFKPRDVEIAREQGLLESFTQAYAVIASPGTGGDLPATFRRNFDLNGKDVSIIIEARRDAASRSVQVYPAATIPHGGSGEVRIVVLEECDDSVLSAAGAEEDVDCFICPPRSDEPLVLSEQPHEPMILTLGRFGRYVSELRIVSAGADGRSFPDRHGDSSGARRNRGDGLSLVFSFEPVTEDLPQAESVEQLYSFYQQLVKETGLLERHPRSALESGLRYTGSGACKGCHGYEYDKWSTKAHAHAYATLQRVGSEYDPECVVCHVVGMDYESGFITPELTGNLTDVGCENCHGPGSRHVDSGGAQPCGRPRSDCMDCHTPDHSHYMGNEEAYFQKIIHWREQKSADNCLNKGAGDIGQ